MHKSFILLLGVVSTVAWADNTIRPGLWEITTKSDLLALVPHIPTEHMQQITNLARQYGLEMPEIRNGAATSTICITQDMAEQDMPVDLFESQFQCAVKHASKTGNRYQVDLVCDNAQFKGNGTAEVVFTNPESFTGQAEFDSVVQGNPVYTRAESRGWWIGPDCTLAQPLQ